MRNPHDDPHRPADEAAVLAAMDADELTEAYLLEALIGEEGRRGQVASLVDAVARHGYRGEESDETDGNDHGRDEDLGERHSRLARDGSISGEYHGLLTRPLNAIEMVVVPPVVELVIV